MFTQKALIVTHQALYPYHTVLANDLQCAFLKLSLDSAVLDLSDNQPDYLYFQSIQDYAPDLLVTFDFAGFYFTNETGEPSYNGLGCIMAHIAIAPLTAFESHLSHLLSFSMFFYTASPTEAASIAERFPLLPNLCVMDALIPDATSGSLHNHSIFFHLFTSLLEETTL